MKQNHLRRGLRLMVPTSLRCVFRMHFHVPAGNLAVPADPSVIRPGNRMSALRRGRAVVRWTIVAYVAIQLAFVALVDVRVPEILDSEYRARIDLLEKQVQQHPERPVLLVLGSSHFGGGFEPSRLPELPTGTGELAIPFNFSHLAGGARSELVQLNRVLRKGIQPRWVIVEFCPAVMHHEAISVQYAGAADLPLLMRHDNPVKVGGIFLRSRLNPFFNTRMEVLEEIAPAFVTHYGSRDRVSLLALGDDKHWSRPDFMEEDRKKRNLQVSIDTKVERLGNIVIDPKIEGALRETIATCRQRGIQVVLVIPPEHSRIRAIYSAATRRTIDELCAKLRAETGVAIVDTWAWMDDVVFYDGEHLLPEGAKIFTERLGREVLTPLVRGDEPYGPLRPDQRAGR